MVITVARAGIKFSWWAYANLNLPVKPVMNEARALAALKFDNLKEVDDESHWANILSTKVITDPNSKRKHYFFSFFPDCITLSTLNV